MERKDQMPAEVAPRHADIANNTDKASTRNKNAKDVSPDLLKFAQELFVVFNVTQLIGVFIVPFQIPIGWRRDNKMHRLIIQKGQVSCIAANQSVRCLRHSLT